MGLSREPKGVDFIVGPSVLTDKDRKMISEVIANYKKPGKYPLKQKSKHLVNAEALRDNIRLKRRKSCIVRRIIESVPHTGSVYGGNIVN